MSVLYGVDVSEHNGFIEWTKVRDSKKVDFVMIRAGYGQGTVDKQFHKNALMCNTLDIPIGIYWFSYATTVDAAAREAEACLKTIKDYKITYPVAFDFEDDSVRVAKKNGVTITKSLATLMAMSFLSVIKNAGYEAVNYSNPAYLNQYFDSSVKANFPLWLAQWPVNPRPEIRPIQSPVIWQYDANGRIPGINSAVDLNVSYVDYANKEETIVNNPLTKEEILKVLNFEKQKSWFEKETDGETLLETAKSLGFTDGSNPYEIPSRAEVMTMISRAYLSLERKMDSRIDEIRRDLKLDDGK